MEKKSSKSFKGNKMTECQQAVFVDLNRYKNEDGLPIMDQQTFVMIKNTIGKEEFR